MEFDGYCKSYLQQWDERATVRTLARSRLSEDMEIQEFFPAQLQPLAEHPAVTSRGPEAVRELLVRTAYAWQTDVVLVETDIVVHLCNELANKGPGCPIPTSARQVALTIATDEVYHAYAAREFIEDVRQYTGIEPPQIEEGEASLAKSLSVAIASAPTSLRREVETMVLCFGEHLVTESLFGVSKETEPNTPFHRAIHEHLLDEGRHQGFFRKLLRHLWTSLDEERRCLLGRVLPPFLDDLFHDLQGYQDNNVALLEQMGFAPTEASAIANEICEGVLRISGERKDRMPHARHCLKLVRLAGLLDHAPTREALVESGWFVVNEERP